MNSSGRMFWCIYFVIVVTNTTHFAFGQHEPLYVSKSRTDNKYYLIYDVEYEDDANTQLVVMKPFGGEVLTACPQKYLLSSVEIKSSFPKKAPFSLDCKTPIKSHVFITKSERRFLSNVIGFLLYTPNEEHQTYYEDVPIMHAVVVLIRFDLDNSLLRIKNVQYCLGIGKFLKPEISGNHQTNEDQKDSDIFGYDLDDLYSKSLLEVVKVPLAPEEDFFFSNWKSASKHNILTAPMRKDLLVQWQALEIYTRKVAQIVDSINVQTGVYETLTQPDSSQKIFLHDGKHPIPKYFWKAIYIEIAMIEPVFSIHYHGILFVMHNVDPTTKSNEEKICPNDDVSKVEWKFLPDNLQLKSLMYACFLNQDNLKIFQEKMYSMNDYKPFDLNNVPRRITDGEGNTIGVESINVLEEMEKLQKKTNSEG